MTTKHNKAPRRTKLDIMYFMLNQLGGPTMVRAFKRDWLQSGQLSPSVHEEITEEEYQHSVAQATRELPALVAFLASGPHHR